MPLPPLYFAIFFHYYMYFIFPSFPSSLHVSPSLFPHLPHSPLQSRKVSSIEHEIKMGITTVPPMQPQDKIPLRIHTVDHTCCRLQVRVDSTAKAIIKEACAKLQLDPANFNLCEVKSSGEKNPLDDNDISVHSEISVNGRLYIVPKSHSEKTVVCLCLCKYMYVCTRVLLS